MLVNIKYSIFEGVIFLEGRRMGLGREGIGCLEGLVFICLFSTFFLILCYSWSLGLDFWRVWVLFENLFFILIICLVVYVGFLIFIVMFRFF